MSKCNSNNRQSPAEASQRWGIQSSKGTVTAKYFSQAIYIYIYITCSWETASGIFQVPYTNFCQCEHGGLALDHIKYMTEISTQMYKTHVHLRS